MESENETRPLLHDFESETWRSKARKRCLRIPSEVAITGIILGLFFVVVTLLIVLENMEETKESDISLDRTLLASPFKYNKKAEDKSWQDKKDKMRPKSSQNDPKWDNANKGWKKFPDISGKIDNRWKNRVQKTTQANVNNLELPAIEDEYGKELEDSLEELINIEKKHPNYFEISSEDTTDISSLLLSPKFKWNKIDDGWKRLSKQGNKEIENQKMKGKNEVDHQKSINDEWKNKMTLLQSPKANIKNTVKADDGWKKLSEQGWKVDDIKKAVSDAWNDKEDLLQSPMNLQNLFGKESDILKNNIQKGMDKQKSQKDTNDEWASKFGSNLQSSMSSSKKGSIINQLSKKQTKYDQKDKSADKGGQDENQQAINFEDFLENIVEMIKGYQKDKEAKNTDKTGTEKENLEYSSMNAGDFLKNIIDVIKENQKGNKEAENQKSINSEWKNGMKVLQSSKNSDQKWKKVDDHWKTLNEYDQKGYFGKNDATKTPSPKDDGLQHTMSLDNIKWENVDSGWKKLTDQGWKDQDLKEAVYKAWKEGPKLLQSATGYNNMKWKKVNDGWKKISNKS